MLNGNEKSQQNIEFDNADRILTESVVVTLTNFPLWNLQFVHAYHIWDRFKTKGNGVRIAVIDSGIDESHPDLEGKVIDVVQIGDGGMNQNKEELHHGTIIAGVIAGAKTGIAPEASIIDIRIPTSKNAMDVYLEEAIDTCFDFKPDIVNISQGGPYFHHQIRKRCDQLSHSSLIVASAGNLGTGAHFPASYPSVISVAALDELGQHAIFSNIWPTIDITAPGVKVVSTYPTDEKQKSRYCIDKGTSLAAPHISGIFALAISYLKMVDFHRQIVPGSLRKLLMSTAYSMQEEPYKSEALAKIREYQEKYDPKTIFLKENRSTIEALFGSGMVNGLRFMTALSKNA